MTLNSLWHASLMTINQPDTNRFVRFQTGFLGYYVGYYNGSGTILMLLLPLHYCTVGVIVLFPSFWSCAHINTLLQ